MASSSEPRPITLASDEEFTEIDIKPASPASPAHRVYAIILTRAVGIPLRYAARSLPPVTSRIPTARVKMIAYTLCAGLAGLAGLISISVNSSSDANVIGLGSELDAIAAVAVGGTALTGGRAYIVGTLIGALIIQLLRYTLLAHGIPDAAALVVKAGIIIGAVDVQRRHR